MPIGWHGYCEDEIRTSPRRWNIVDGVQGKGSGWIPRKSGPRSAIIPNMPKDKKSDQDPGFCGRLSFVIARCPDKPDVKRESLGEKDIDGRQVVGFRLSGRV